MNAARSWRSALAASLLLAAGCAAPTPEEVVRAAVAEGERLVEAANHGMPTLIDHYGATSPGEFFAVVTEHFFETPTPLREHHPDLYRVLRAYYRQDPARRADGA